MLGSAGTFNASAGWEPWSTEEGPCMSIRGEDPPTVTVPHGETTTMFVNHRGLVDFCHRLQPLRNHFGTTLELLWEPFGDHG